MATTTPNFGWPVPTSTDLVKDGATAIEALGDSIDASLLDLKGGTSGQVLAKNSNTDMDFIWVAQDDSNAIQNTIVDAKGDLIGATAADTPARLAVGTNGQVLTADSTAATGIKWAAPSSGALTLITAQSFSAASTVNVNDVFSATYENYLVLLNGTTSSSGDMEFRFRVSAADNTTSNYFIQYNDISNTTNNVLRQTSQTKSRFGNCDTNERFASEIMFYKPFTAEKKFVDSLITRSNTGSGIGMGRVLTGFDAATSFTGFSILPSAGNITGSVKIYGYSN